MKYKIKFTEFERLLIKATKFHFGKDIGNIIFKLHNIEYMDQFSPTNLHNVKIVLHNLNNIANKLGKPINVVNLICNESYAEHYGYAKTKSDVLFIELLTTIQSSVVQNNFTLRTPIAVQKRIKSLLKEQENV